jgi:hypothetical protein
MPHSHANATDLGVMLDRFAEMSQRLDVNVVGYDYVRTLYNALYMYIVYIY